MRFRVKNNIDYGNIIKDDIEISYKNNKMQKKIIKKKKIENILNNQNFRNNQNYVLSKKIIKNNFNFLSKVIFTLFSPFILVIITIILEINILLGIFVIFVFIFIFIYLFKDFKKNDNFRNNFIIKENYYKKFFIYIVDKK